MSIFGGNPISDPLIAWQGVQKIVVWSLDASLAGGLLALGCAAGIAGLCIVSETSNG
jgi:hypothetical protein